MKDKAFIPDTKALQEARGWDGKITLYWVAKFLATRSEQLRLIASIPEDQLDSAKSDYPSLFWPLCTSAAITPMMGSLKGPYEVTRGKIKAAEQYLKDNGWTAREEDQIAIAPKHETSL